MEYYLRQAVVVIVKDNYVARGTVAQVTQNEVLLADYNLAPMTNLEEYICKGSGDDYLIIPKVNVISMCRK